MPRRARGAVRPDRWSGCNAARFTVADRRCGHLSGGRSGEPGAARASARVERYDLGGLLVPVAALADVIRSKQAANRPKDQAALPTLRSLLAQRQREASRR